MTHSTFAWVFPGQGSQSLGMLADIAPIYSEIGEVFARASAVLGYDLWEVTQAGPEALLNQTDYTQPAILAASYAIWTILINHSTIRPTQLAGHSLGEYTALVCAGALPFEEAVKLVELRGRYMQEAVQAGVGAMAAIVGLEEETVNAICLAARQKEDEVIAPANFNSPGQVVVAGQAEAVLRAIALAKAKGAKMAVLIPVSVPSHCLLMKPAADRLAEILLDVPFAPLTLPVLNNADVAYYTTPDSIREGLTKQLYSPVRWVETIQALQTAGATHVIECGPGKVLTGLNKRINKQLQLQHTADLVALQSALSLLGDKLS